tara:strand:- start:237 stop:647 length:411 start_codon:yes stop_codon:yes gene_type:complete
MFWDLDEWGKEMILKILGTVGNLAATYLDGKVEGQRSAAEIKKAEAVAKAEIMKTAATHEAGWEKIMATASKDSWKDELWTIVFVLILIGNFIPIVQPIMAAGFENLSNCPTWVQVGMYASIASSFGLRGISKFKG